MEPIQFEQRGKVLCVRPVGRLGQAEGAEMLRQVEARLALGDDLLLDLGAVEYMTSSAVGAVVELYQRVRPSGGQVAVAASDERVHLLLEIAGLDQLLTLCRSRAEAEAALGLAAEER